MYKLLEPKSCKNSYLFLTVNHRTKQKAAQNWCLIRSLPLLVGDLIPEGNEHLDLILTLLSIMDIVFAPAISVDQTFHLECLVEEFYEKYEELFPSIEPINKMHHLLHYAHLIRTHGPPVTF